MMRALKALAAVIVIIALGGFFCLINFHSEKSQLLDGEKEEYFFFNQKVGEKNFKNGVQEGPTRTYYSDGKIKSEFQFKNGVREGVAKFYTAEGNLRYQDEYSGGVKKSRKEYDSVGDIVSEKKFK